MYTPRLAAYPVGGNVSFQCEDGFTLQGSPVRHCRPNGMWDGETAVCDNGGECPGCCSQVSTQGVSGGPGAWSATTSTLGGIGIHLALGGWCEAAEPTQAPLALLCFSAYFSAGRIRWERDSKVDCCAKYLVSGASVGFNLFYFILFFILVEG